MCSTKFFIFVACSFVVLALQAEAKFRIKIDNQTDSFEGDIQLPRTRNGILQHQRWTDGKIYYELREPWMKEKEYQDILLEAMKEIQDHTCIRFFPRTTQENYIVIYNGTGCHSQVGMAGGRQGLSLKESNWTGGCWYHGTVVHELLHAVGLWHEQSRYDRDDYIKINTDNIIKGTAYNFDLKFENETSTYGVPYNYLSIMHYSNNAFSKDGSITIETHDPSAQDLIGNRKNGADTDYEKVRRIYDCEGTFPTMPTPTTTPPPPCQDTYEYCDQYKHECGKPGFTEYGCRRTCGYCSDDCTDKIDYCHQYFKECKTASWMKDACARSCHHCRPN